ncbi:hypothetical protein CD30_15165 [Ureibacillus massiliensis 4400831 = CIP 108448 = CCUG 49529]|uniref:Uncharacterized protein n=1 Tax=Ureibacillus massiliensis 4400831 = CIP 108448 = CCUG 49529 TaxID=1211035 RepID=A0A0A3IYK8_9BACL|nr:hypothetical protein [Ureibacillus massiliensis]KGR89839.1 hypothetical protein CD30_15165 [Ureibacillus massiliensis 4400831 = CIP 108448 = CCUG 49529]
MTNTNDPLILDKKAKIYLIAAIFFGICFFALPAILSNFAVQLLGENAVQVVFIITCFSLLLAVFCGNKYYKLKSQIRK